MGFPGQVKDAYNDLFGSEETHASDPGTTTTSQVTTPSTTTAGPTTTAVTTTTLTTTRLPASGAPAAATVVDQIDVYIKVLAGEKLGPDLYAASGTGTFGLGYGWTGTTDGAEVKTDACQITMQVTGPEDFPVQRSAQCSKQPGGPFNGGDNSEGITVFGTYTITVTDELTGTVGQKSFTVTAG
ncbi:hypothetical protein BJF84_17325 [Rhodococcus sp. CUA-806]|nr:hypothetical protein BJF84_17325 [Rhodococcus sp. CUA-806]